MPKVSVIVPVYGVEKYIERCAVSLFEQTLDDIEYIFIDDCTPDRSMEILYSVIEKYQHRLLKEKKVVKIERMPSNSGLPTVRKKGLQLFTGDYVIHCDSDDWVHTNMYREMYEKAIQEDADMVVCNYQETNGADYNKDCCAHLQTDWDSYFDDLLHLNVTWAIWNKLIKSNHTKSITEYPSGNMGEDMAYVLQMMSTIKKISFIDKSMYYYFVNPNSITKCVDETKIEKNFIDICNNVQIVLRKWSEINTEKKF